MRKLFPVLVAAVAMVGLAGCYCGPSSYVEETRYTEVPVAAPAPAPDAAAAPPAPATRVERVVRIVERHPVFQPFFYGYGGCYSYPSYGYGGYPSYGGYGYGGYGYDPNCGVAGPDWVRFQAAWGFPPRY